MIKVPSLTDPQIFLNKVSVVVADIDFTLIDFAKAHNAGIEALKQKMNKQFGDRVGEIFKLLNDEHSHADSSNWKRYPEFLELLKDIEEVEKFGIEKNGMRKWSREAWILIAFNEQGVKYTKDDVLGARDTYWQALLEKSTFYFDAKMFLDKLKKNNIPMILMTGSDSIAKVNEDLTWEYDAVGSKQYKLDRLQKLAIPNKAIVIGDPYDKPDARFFDEVFAEVKKLGNFPKEEIIFIGDSPKSDCDVPDKLGYPTFLIKR